jgi:hypothetical protein
MPLRHFRVSARTSGRYAVEVMSCIRFWRQVGVWPRSMEDLDGAVGEYLEFLWSEGDNCSRARYLVAGIQYFVPSTRRHLELAWTLVRTWARMEPPHRAIPFSCDLVLALSALAVEKGMQDVAVLLLIAFEAMLRTGEAFMVAARDVLFTARGAILRLPRTKMGVRQAREEMVQIYSPIAVSLLRRAVAERPDGGLLARRRPDQLRVALKSLLAVFELHELGYSWYSLRRGGATVDFLEHGSMETTIVRGRWTAGRTARIYIEQAIADSVTAAFTPRQAALVRLYAARWTGQPGR